MSRNATTDDIRIADLQQLIAPTILMQQVSISDEATEVVKSARDEAAAIIAGNDDRLIAVVGPCSIHDVKAAHEYADKLKAYADTVKEDLLIIMRVYFEKPRTTVGWKGLINDPNMNDSYEINEGLRVARQLLLELSEKGIPAGTEFLDTISPQYYADLVSWGAIGARTTESQCHRELASGLSMPVGFKNGTGGNYQIAIDAIGAASHPHRFLSVTKSGDTAIVATTGNDTCHIILRGGKTGPNYDFESVSEVRQALEKNGITNKIMIDCSHANSSKDYKNQPAVCANIGEQVAGGDASICSVMIESHLSEGNQKLDPDNLDSLEYGVSITDSCVDWDTTVEMLDNLAESVRKRRATYLA